MFQSSVAKLLTRILQYIVLGLCRLDVRYVTDANKIQISFVNIHMLKLIQTKLFHLAQEQVI